ncbi:Protein GltF [Pseudomonas fluorescens]|uniref:Protein GltF n=1 Tax=Pseudomonas fluorescens TaxID=294 RepID=A0A5E6XRG7_PSEFL|nr:DUF1120 domain-containing protein [Pseudomonas fluorescens]VVN43556.1 Protein GltF [Pseudomonas fluorescens]
MNKYLAALTACTLITVAPFALAASSTELTVTGSITPSACMPMLSGGGNINLGKIPVKDLNPDPDQYTRLPNQYVQFTVTCNANTAFAIHSIDNKAGTVYGQGYFGLGLTDAGEKLGNFEVYHLTVQADGNPAELIYSEDGGGSWAGWGYLGPGLWTAVSAPGTTDPLPATSVEMDLEISASIAPTKGLTLTDEVIIDGSATFEVKYL